MPDVPDEPGEDLLPESERRRLARGQPYESADRDLTPEALKPETERDRRFSEGQELEPETAEEERIGNFATGQEHHLSPRDPGAIADERELLPETERPRRFSEGQEVEGETPEKERRGDFATGQRAEDRTDEDLR